MTKFKVIKADKSEFNDLYLVQIVTEGMALLGTTVAGKSYWLKLMSAPTAKEGEIDMANFSKVEKVKTVLNADTGEEEEHKFTMLEPIES